MKSVRRSGRSREWLKMKKQFRPKEGSTRTRADRIELQTKAAAATLPRTWQAEFLDFVRKEPGRRSLR